MPQINVTRVLLGGLAAGVVINIVESVMNTVVLVQQNETALAARNLPPMSDSGIPILVLWGLGVGMVTAWLYAALRAQLGAGARTAVVAGLVVWALAYVAAGIPQIVMGLFTAKLMFVGFAYSLVEMVLAGLVAAWVYREPAGA